MTRRRRLLLGPLALLTGGRAAAGVGPGPGVEPDADPVRRGRTLDFPRDHGVHPSTRIEWWYATGWIGSEQAPAQGFQVTFFRSRTGLAGDLTGRLAPRQLLFAHAALTDLATGRHRHDQRLQRWNGVADPASRAGARADDTSVWIGAWSLQRDAQGYRAEVAAGGDAAWSLSLRLGLSQPVLLQGDRGFSRKGPLEPQASHYYSQPQLTVTGTLMLAGRRSAAAGRAWLDHEWSDQVLAPDAIGWDWIGINLFDGGALTAFVLRRADGSVLWSGGSLRRADGTTRVFGPADVQWQPRRHWRSPTTGARYPVQLGLQTPAGAWAVRSLLDGQELDSRRSTGTVYWEGLSELLDGQGRRVGLGYLEMTGYAAALRL